MPAASRQTSLIKFSSHHVSLAKFYRVICSVVIPSLYNELLCVHNNALGYVCNNLLVHRRVRLGFSIVLGYV